MYFDTNLSVNIAGKTVNTIVKIEADKDGQKIGGYCDIIVPLNCRIQYQNPNNQTVYLTDIPTTLFKSGDPVIVTASYEGFKNVSVFNGYVYDFIEGMPLTIKCLDYVYFCHLGIFGNHRVFTTKAKSSTITSVGTGVNYKSVTLKQLLEDLIAFINQTIAHEAPGAAPLTLMLPTLDMTLVDLTFIYESPAAVLQYLKKELGLNITFYGSQLYVNIASNVTNTVTLSSDRNVLKSGLQKMEAAFQKLRLKAWFINQDGTKNSFEIGDESGHVVEAFFYKVQRQGNNYETLAQNALLKASQHKFNGEIETLLYPDCDIYWSANYTDIRYPSKTGTYTIIAMKIIIDDKGYHRKLKLAFAIDLNIVS